ncbi:MAG: hypothetical protein QXS00_02475 [Pyrobaculum sp.]|uniref:Uncharacterized protein n=2 Tax=Pyrobaculum TaxID=2276 RepID=H6Q838_PYROT|nr:hypothetical protein Pogu_0741 [Pyrobaculum oguniense TE7]
MIDGKTLSLVNLVTRKCENREFYNMYKDICIAAKLVLLNIKGRGVRLRPSLLRLSDLSDIKTASYVLKWIEKEVGKVADSHVIKIAATRYIYERLSELL